MSFKPWLYFLTEDDGRSRIIKNGIVTSTSQPTPLPQTPSGWQDILIGWERNMNRYASVKSFTFPLEFFMVGGKIIRNDKYKPGFNIDRKLNLLIKQFVTEVTPMPGGYFKQYYKQFHKGPLDFSTFENKPDRGSVEISLMESGLAKLIKAYEGMEFEIPFDDDAKTVRLDGINLQQSARFNFLDDVEIRKSEGFLFSLSPMSFVNAEGTASGLSFFESQLLAITGLPFNDVIGGTDYFMSSAASNVGNVDARMVGRIGLKFSQNDPNFAFKMRVLLSSMIGGAGQDDHIIVPQFLPVVDTEYWFDIDHTITMPPETKAFMNANMVTLTPASVDTAYEFLPGSFIDIKYENKYKTTLCLAFTPWDLFRKLIKKITGFDTDAFSDILQTCTYWVTCGDAIRGLENSSVKTTLNDFFKAYDTYLMGGMGIENNKIRFEGRGHCFNTAGTKVLLGNVVLKSVKHAVDLMYPSIKIGHAEQQIDDVNGKFDFNGWHIYKTDVAAGMGSRQLEILSPWKAGPYEIEITRINFEGKTTTDGKADNNIFVLDIDVAGGSVDDAYNLDRSVVPDSGVPSPETIFNVRLRPSELFRTHYRWIRSWLDGYELTSVVFDHANRNGELVVDGKTDGRSVPVLSMGLPMFKPYYMVFSPLVSNDISETLENDINTSFDFDWDRSNYAGFMLRCGIAPNSRKTQEFRLLAWPDNNMTNLI